MRNSCLVGIFLLLFSTTHGVAAPPVICDSGHMEGDRYVGPHGDYSLSMASGPASRFRTDRARSVIQCAPVDRSIIGLFVAENKPSYSLAMRTIEWLKLDNSIEKDRLPAIGHAMLNDFLTDGPHTVLTFFGPAFQFKDDPPHLDADPPNEFFEGTMDFKLGRAAFRCGVLDFEDRLALVCQFLVPGTDKTWHEAGIDEDFDSWALTLRREH
jgi:hypothetical protein